MTSTRDIVQKLWNLCHVLRDDGITYQDYVTELTWLLFLKMAHETGKEAQIPEGYRWRDLEERTGIELLNFYKGLLLHLGTRTDGRVQQIFVDASTSLRQPRKLCKLSMLSTGTSPARRAGRPRGCVKPDPVSAVGLHGILFGTGDL